VLTGIDYIVEECPMAAGNRHLGYKEALNAIEERSPGSKAAFLFGFLERAHERFAPDARDEQDGLQPCIGCGAPTPSEVCAFCRLQARATGTRIPVTVEGALDH
jgi:tRNA(Ile)-lysidine synthase TilS/MesJ